MNILFLTIGRFDSIEVHSLYADLLRCFRNHGHEIYVIAPYQKRTGRRTELIHERGAHALHLETGDLTGSSNLIRKGLAQMSLEFAYIKAIKQYFSDVKFDLVMYSTPPITFCKAVEFVKRRDNAKTYLLLKDIFPQNAVDLGMMTKEGLKGLIYKYFRAKEKKLYALSDFIGCMSQANVDYVLKNNPEINPDKVEICPNCVEVIDKSVDAETRKRIRAKYDIPLDKKVFVYGGNLGKPQGIPFIIEYMKSKRYSRYLLYYRKIRDTSRNMEGKHMKKNVWILNHYAGGMLFQKGGRHYWFAKYLNREGYEPVIFCANTRHGVKEQLIESNSLWVEKKAEEINTPFIFVKSSLYSGNGKERVKNMLGFYCNVQKAGREYAKAHNKPDVIMASSVHPLTLLAGIRLARHFGVKCICEVRDLWPESIVAYSDTWTEKSLLMRILYHGERYLYQKADALIFTFEGAYDYIRDKGWDKGIPKSKVYYINNGIDLEIIDSYRSEYYLEDQDLDDQNVYTIVYVGSIRKVNNIGIILDAAKKINNTNVKVLIWGIGDEFEKIKKRIEKENISNVVLKGRVNKAFIPSIVRRANVNFLHGTETEMIYKYGISPNKLFDYFAAGKPVLCDLRTKYNPVVEEDAGFVTGNTPQEIAEMIDRIVALPADEYEKKGHNAEAAARKYDFKVHANKLIDIIESI